MNEADGVAIRLEAPADAAAVHELLGRAFETPAEADLVDRMRRDGDIVLALVATDAQAVVGHVAFGRLRIESAQGQSLALGLAPLAVSETHRRRGVGAALVREGLDRLRAQGETLVFVLGDPDYYTRFGFALETARPFTCVYAGPYFMALRLSDATPSGGTVRYPSAFDGLA